MAEYFGVQVAGWHDAFPEPVEVNQVADIRYWHDECLPLVEVKDGSLMVAPVSAEDEFGGWEWQPVCDHCHKPLVVNLSQRYLERNWLLVAGD